MYTHGAAGHWQVLTQLWQHPPAHGAPPTTSVGRVPGRSPSPRLVPTATRGALPRLRVCSGDGQERWRGEMAQPCLLSEAAQPGRDLLPAAAPPGLSLHLPCVYGQAPAVPSPARSVCPHGNPSLSSPTHPYPACATSCACCHLHLSLLAGPASHHIL